MAWSTPSDTTACNLHGVYDFLMINIRCMSYKKYHLSCILQVHLHQRQLRLCCICLTYLSVLHLKSRPGEDGFSYWHWHLRYFYYDSLLPTSTTTAVKPHMVNIKYYVSTIRKIVVYFPEQCISVCLYQQVCVYIYRVSIKYDILL